MKKLASVRKAGTEKAAAAAAVAERGRKEASKRTAVLDKVSMGVERQRERANEAASAKVSAFVERHTTTARLARIRELLKEGFKDLSATDIAAGTVLVQAYHAEYLHLLAAPTAPPMTGVEDSEYQFTVTLEKYMRFAGACYGAQMYHAWVNTQGKGAKAVAGGAAQAVKAANVMQYTNRQVMCEMTGLTNDDIIESDWKSGSAGKVSSVAYCIALDKKSRTLVITFRGTLDVQDGLRDLCAQGMDFKLADGSSGKVHAGIFEAVRDFDKEATPRICAWMQPEAYGKHIDEVVLTGHSLGAGVANLYHILLRRAFDGNPEKYDDAEIDAAIAAAKGKEISNAATAAAAAGRAGSANRDLSIVPIHSYAFACPCTGTLDVSRSPEALPSATKGSCNTIALQYDVISRLSYGALLNLKELMQQLNAQSASKSQKLMHVLSTETVMTDAQRDAFNSVLKGAPKPDVSKVTNKRPADTMFPTGTAYHITYDLDPLRAQQQAARAAGDETADAADDDNANAATDGTTVAASTEITATTSGGGGSEAGTAVAAAQQQATSTRGGAVVGKAVAVKTKTAAAASSAAGVAKDTVAKEREVVKQSGERRAGVKERMAERQLQRERSYSLYKSEPELFQDVVITEGMMLDHDPARYLAALNLVLKNMRRARGEPEDGDA
eukprot:CAMPEP_0198342266 /NCGR_PEP_ID=MMETSP1450-20131203/50978_1 /TAXON_ID=753684 ORGANISM="Madagascaria erythrocladiodes, Strain CCMP3234" /NCGR_SAMPLE_ID=MMETSP1450 /ASSEMBLY_ACC=CAM_ASM_001115 /LENGTH=668 /DNA_ID=CAMNT_0044047353 /DNA_START=73 /DNA_END=2079 /DNA_ORIENTATION=-